MDFYTNPESGAHSAHMNSYAQGVANTAVYLREIAGGITHEYKKKPNEGPEHVARMLAAAETIQTSARALDQAAQQIKGEYSP